MKETSVKNLAHVKYDEQEKILLITHLEDAKIDLDEMQLIHDKSVELIPENQKFILYQTVIKIMI